MQASVTDRGEPLVRVMSNSCLIILATLRKTDQRLETADRTVSKSLKEETGLMGTRLREIRGARMW